MHSREMKWNVLSQVRRGGKRKEGKIVRIVSHQVKKIVGLYEKSKSLDLYVRIIRDILKDIYIRPEKRWVPWTVIRLW